MKILVTGVKGQLGYDVVRELSERGFTDVLGIDKEECDITKEQDVLSFIRDYKPNVVVHCAAWTAVDLAEDKKELVYDVNVKGTSFIAKACQQVDAKMVYISTDYVFDGIGEQPFEVTDIPNPMGYYGETKYLGELETKKFVEKHFIVRISWVFGLNGNNFVKTMLRLGNERGEVKVVSDQFGSPTYTYDLSKLLCDMIMTEKYGTYHATNEGICNWYEFACEIFKQAQLKVMAHPLTTEQYPTKAVRPKNSRMSKQSLIDNGFHLLPTWQEALNRYLKEIGVVK